MDSLDHPATFFAPWKTATVQRLLLEKEMLLSIAANLEAGAETCLEVELM